MFGWGPCIACFCAILVAGLLYEFLKDLIAAKMAVKRTDAMIDAAIIKITRSIAELMNKKEVNEK